MNDKLKIFIISFVLAGLVGFFCRQMGCHTVSYTLIVAFLVFVAGYFLIGKPRNEKDI